MRYSLNKVVSLVTLRLKLFIFIRMLFKKYLCFFLLLIITKTPYAQYTLNGNAAQISCNEYRLTDAVNTQSGSVWNNIKIDLTQPFDFNFDVFLGNNNSPGADGIAFVMQPISTSVGSTGGGLGYEGITPAVGVTIDTYQNGNNNDPAEDHIAIQLNGDISHNTANNIAGPVSALNGNSNIEDGRWHSLHIVWDTAGKTLTAYVDGSLRVSVVKDFVTDVFSGNPLVYWGFTGSTGGENNYQGFKTALSPYFNFNPAQKRCLNEPITFYDSTIIFTSLAKWWWDFGDGSPVDSVNLNPVHTYTTAGVYTVVQRVRGADGCEATNTVMVTIGSKPVAGFFNDDNCVVNTIQFNDTSNTAFGTINRWFWDFGNSLTSVIKNPSTTYTTGGDKIIKLAVKSIEGCESDTLLKPVHIYTRPVIDFTFTDSVCLGSSTNFFGTVTSSSDPVVTWQWHFDNDPNFPVTQNATYSFTTAGSHNTLLLATSNGSAGCAGIISKNVFVTDKPYAGMKGISICQSQPVNLSDSSYTTDGITINGWWWDLGNGQFSTQKNPATTYNSAGPIIIRHVAVNSKGCISDTLTQTINVSAKPIANFGYSNLLCSGLPVQFSDSTVVAGGSISQWSWLYNGTEFSTIENPSRTFTAGLQTVKLVATSNDGCVSDTVSKTFIINPSPDVSFTFNDACKNSLVNFSAVDNSGTVTSWKWTFGDGAIALAQDTTYRYTAGGVYPVKLYATAANGCYSDSLQKNITIYSTNAFAGNDTIAAANQPVQLQATGGINYSWSPAVGLNNPNISNPVANINSTQTYVVKAFTPLGCESYNAVTIKIYDGPEIYLPNAFTPNGDGLNDIFKGTMVGLKEFKFMKIFNRFGQEIFYTTDAQKGWDGTWKGKQQNSGVYVVIASGIDYRGLAIDKKATVILIR